MMTVSAVARLMPGEERRGGRRGGRGERGCARARPAALSCPTQPARPRREQKHEVRAPRRVEMVHGRVPGRRRRGAVEALKEKAAQFAVVGDDVEHAHHLGEDEHAVPGLLEAAQQLVQEHHFARREDEAVGFLGLGNGGRRCRRRVRPRPPRRRRLRGRRRFGVLGRVQAVFGLGRFKQKRVVATFLQFGDDVEERHLGRPLGPPVEVPEVAGEHPPIILLLQGRHAHAQDALVFRGERFLDVFDHAAQQVRLELGVQAQHLLRLAHAVLGLERVGVVEFDGVEEMEEGPEFL